MSNKQTSKKIIRDKEEYYIMVRGSVLQEGIIFKHMCLATQCQTM